MFFRRVGCGARLACLVAVETAAVATLHRAGSVPPFTVDWGDLGSWLVETPPEDAVAAAVRLIALGVAWWLLATTALYVGGSLVRFPALARGIGWATLPSIRRLVDAAVATALVVGPVGRSLAPLQTVASVRPLPAVAVSATLAGDDADRHAYEPTPAGDGVPATTTTSAALRHRPGSAPAATSPSPEGEDRPGHAGPETTPRLAAGGTAHMVAPGDHLWKIAAQRVAEGTGQDPESLDEAEIRRYWLALMTANEGRLRSGDPDLIFPGEVVVLPPLDE